MSHDQKPGKMRVVGSSAAVAPAPQRRRTDGASATAVATGVSGTAVPAAGGAPGAAAAGLAAATSGNRRPVMLLGLLFVAGCAIGGAALPLLGWLS